MAKQINEYTKTRTQGTIQLDDLMDLDSTDDFGASYESAKLTVEEFRKYLAAAIPTLYSDDGQIDALRNVGLQGFAIEFENGTLINKADLNDVGYLLQKSTGAEMGSLGFDAGDDTATLELKNTAGTFLKAINGTLGVGLSVTAATMHVKTATFAGATDIFKLESNADLFTVKDNGDVLIGEGDFVVNGNTVNNIIFADHSSNFVGIGNPSTPLRGNLHVNQSSGVANPSVISNNSGLVVGASLSNSALRLGIDASFKAYIAGGRTNSTLSTALQINPLGANVEILPNGSGNLGVNKVSPIEMVDVVGNVAVTGVYKVGGAAGFTGTGAYTNFTIVGGIITNATV